MEEAYMKIDILVNTNWYIVSVMCININEQL